MESIYFQLSVTRTILGVSLQRSFEGSANAEDGLV
jgi:hypothetical protein